MQERSNIFMLMIRRWWLLATPVILLLMAGGFLMANSCTTLGATIKGDRLERIQASPHYKDGIFVNDLAAQQPPLLKTLREWTRGSDHQRPDAPVPVITRYKGDFAEAPPSGLRITWLGHSTALIEIDGKRILTDPMWSQRSSPVSFAGPKRFFDPPLALADLPPVDVVLISHDHYDHLDKPTVQSLGATGTQFVMPLGVGAYLEAWGIAPNRITELDWWQTARLDDLRITATPARHFSGRSPIMTDRDATLWAGFALRGPRHRVYYSGDTGMFPDFTAIGDRLGPFNAVLVETGAYNRLWADLHLGPEQALEAVRMAKGSLMIPLHWGTFNLAMHGWTEPAERLLAAAPGYDFALAIPRPGQSIEPANPPAPVRWWPEIPWQTAREHPVVSSGMTPPQPDTTAAADPATGPASAVPDNSSLPQ